MAASESQKKATARYDSKNISPVYLKLNKKTDADILNKLDSVENKQGYIKELIRSDIRKESNIYMKISVRIKAVRAMDLLARAVNDEGILFDEWLMLGVADGDITGNESDEDLAFYAEDKTFRELMGCFLRCMKDAYEDGGLYIDGIVSQ